MSEGRGLTLRKKKTQKRPVISAPVQRLAQQTTSGGTAEKGKNLDVPRQRPAPSSETSDLVKRRYSTRYNQLPNFGGNDVPDVPALPGAGTIKRRSGGLSPRRPQSAHSSHPLRVDQDVLADPNLEHERYVTDLLSNASETDIQEYQNNLKRIKNRTSMDLQQSVYQNRTQFIKISKEAEKLKSEMSVLRGLMTELTTALDQRTSTGGGIDNSNVNGMGTMTSAQRKNVNRSSVANLEAMWNTQLQALWKHVEKSQKFLPAVPGRHVVMENGHWIELDSATWKPKRPVHIVLLNDNLLVASKKRKKVDPNAPQSGPAPTKLVAEECWPLQDIDVVDLSASLAGGQTTSAEEKAIAGAIAIRSGNKTWTYRHEKRDDRVKQEVLLNIRKTGEELRKANLPKTDPRSARNELDYFATRDTSSTKGADILSGIDSSKGKPDILIEVDGKQQNFRWVEGQIDELDIDIALQHVDVAVEKIEKLRGIAKGLKGNSMAQELIMMKVNERAAKLATVLCRDLVDTPSFAEPTKRSTDRLIRLGFEDRAREAYLNARAEALTQRQRQCVFDGDLHKYVFSISYVYFTIIKNTVMIFQASFPATAMSACIKWANEHLEIFNALLVRQLGAVEKGGKVWRDCMDVVWTHEREMLGDVGLDFREVIGRGLELKDRTSARSMDRGERKHSASRSKSRARAGSGKQARNDQA